MQQIDTGLQLFSTFKEKCETGKNQINASKAAVANLAAPRSTDQSAVGLRKNIRYRFLNFNKIRFLSVFFLVITGVRFKDRMSFSKRSEDRRYRVFGASFKRYFE